MNEYISREAVEQVLCGIENGLSVGEAEALKTKDVKALYKIKGAKEILNAVDNDLCFIPAADVQPVKHGKWEYNDKPIFGNPYGRYCCSLCGSAMDSGEDNYCPCCGARMDGDVEGRCEK